VLNVNVIAEEPCPLAAGMGDQGFLLAEFQSEGLPEEPGDSGLDFLGFGLWPGEPQDMVIRLCRGPGYAGIE
jgi:hypothetical protein